MKMTWIRNSKIIAQNFHGRFTLLQANKLCCQSNRSLSSGSISTPHVGFIGLGNMGLPMSLNLQKNGKVPVMVYDVNPTACTTAKSKGLHVSHSLRHMIETIMSSTNDTALPVSSTIFTMLPTCSVVDNVMNELIQSVNDVTSSDTSNNKIVVVDCSTVSPSISRKWYTSWTDHGHVFFDAPVSGGVSGAHKATLTFMVGATKHEQGLQFVRPYLNCMGSKIIECGNPGAGSVTKLCNNLALAAQMIGICEALTLADALGVDPVIVSDVMNVSTAKCWSSEVNNPHPEVATAKRLDIPASRNYEGGFGTNLMIKDLSLALDAASESGKTLPITSLSQKLYKAAATESGLGEKDFAVMFQYLKDLKT